MTQPHPAYSRNIDTAVVPLLQDFRPPEDTDPSGLEAGIHRAFHDFAQNLADRLPNGPKTEQTVRHLRETLDTALEAAQGQ